MVTGHPWKDNKCPTNTRKELLMDMDYGALPPEINSGRMYSGPGPGSLLTAAAAWDQLPSELNITASSYRSVISRLVGGAWTGPSAAAMAAPAHTYVAWLHTTASQAEQTASQTKAAVSAYSAALTATVPPPVIAANRTFLTQLIQSNFFGQNAPAIGTVEAHYAEMWAQDAAAMYGYATSSAAASTLTPFTNPPQTTNPGWQATQAASVAQVAGTSAGAHAQSTIAQLLGSLTPGLGSPGTTGASGLTSVSSTSGELANIAALPVEGFANGVGSYSSAADLISNINNGMGLATFAAQSPGKLVEALSPPFLGPASSLGMSGRAGVSAGLGQAIQIGAVSVPQGWAMPTSATTPVAMTLPIGSGSAAGAALIDGIPGSAFGETMLGTLAGRGLGAVTARNVVSRNRKVVPQSPAVG